MARRDWMRLPAAVRARFSKHREAGQSVVYRGQITEIRFSRLGWVLAQALRLIGAPLPLDREAEGRAAVVAVTEGPGGSGQIWTRLIAREGRFPQMIHSAKRFSGPTGLEERVGHGIGMTLRIAEENGSLVFRSAGYFIEVLGRRLSLPRWMTPGDLVVGHHDLRRGRFAFTLDLTHPIFGPLIHQTAIYADMSEKQL
ncbi:MAG: DUF4166 domain-containing protein [Pseudomonadota bacterium]